METQKRSEAATRDNAPSQIDRDRSTKKVKIRDKTDTQGAGENMDPTKPGLAMGTWRCNHKRRDNGTSG